MAHISWRTHIKTAVAETIACVSYDLVVARDSTPRSAQLQIEVRKWSERDAEVDYWMEELESIPHCFPRYQLPKDGRGGRYIKITLWEESPK